MRKTVEIALVAAVMLVGLTGCNKGVEPASAADSTQPNSAGTVVADSNPANGNLAPVSQTSSYSQPADSQQPDSYDVASNSQDYPPDSGYYSDASDQAIQTTEPPPPLPVYEQPEIPGDDYYWTPGYWAWGPGGYYWVPGAWVVAPFVDALWTPPYWAFDSGNYRWHSGYWGPHIGFYGGINYGFGYTGRGYYGAYWNGGHLFYNRAVIRVNETRVHNVYNYSVPAGVSTRVSYNGGSGGITMRPSPQERAVVRDPRTPPVAAQAEHAREASRNRGQFASNGQLPPAALVAARPLATTYRAPAEKPPAAAMRQADRFAARPAQNQPNIPAAPVQAAPVEGPRDQRQQQPRMNPENGPRPENRPEPVMRPNPQIAPVPQPQPQPIPDQRRGPENRQQNRPEMRPAPVAPAPAPAPATRPAEVRPAPQVMRPAPQQMPEQQRPEMRAQPRQENRPVPVQRAPEVRPAAAPPQQQRAAPPAERAAPPQQAAPPPQRQGPPPAAPRPNPGEQKKDKEKENK